MRQKKLAQSVERSEEGERSLRRRSGEEVCLRRQARDDERPWVRLGVLPGLLQATRDGGRVVSGFVARSTFLFLDGS
jgi:hypothetical protein